jgi:putative oxidoreductase
LGVIHQREDVALLVGRLFLASMFLPSGLEKLMSFSKFAAALAAKGLPDAKVWAVLSVASRISAESGPL